MAMLTSQAARETVKRLNASVSELKKASDLDGLLRLQAEALAVSAKTDGRVHRKAKRIANKASGAVNDILDRGGETRLGRDERMARAAREVREPPAPKPPEIGTLEVLTRILNLLHLVLFEGSPIAEEMGLLQGLALFDADGFLKIEFPDPVRAQASTFVKGFEQSRKVFKSASYRRDKTDVERALKVLALELISQGAEVRHVGRDSVPLVAYGLFVGRITSDVKSPTLVSDKIDDVTLSVSNDVASVPPAVRPLFIEVFRLSLLMGEAQAYADRHGVAAILPPPERHSGDGAAH
jgi:hypothetical protein